MTEAFNAHQNARQGLRPGGGPDGARCSERGLRGGRLLGHGRRQRLALGAGDEALIAELAHGFADAVRETGRVPAPTIADWRVLSRTGAVVGHTDTLALPPTR